ncbi:hypothetical protein KIW84_024441 [Lathyrus oleraceus]|uniref:Uncharacterized protein n=1 Tax=Pisum sativum TaxID=3888 RepID=A0A9D5BCV2_PEA|nr:hypothetical protein KIW84_024441 [Pisum sativum]
MLQLWGPDPDGSHIFPFLPDILAWAQSVGKQHDIIDVTIRSDTTNGIRDIKNLIMGCERGGNYQKKDAIAGSYALKVKCPFMLQSMPIGSSWKVTVRCEFHNHTLSKGLYGNDILGRVEDHERKFVIDMTKYNMAPRYIVAALKDRDRKNLMSVI